MMRSAVPGRVAGSLPRRIFSRASCVSVCAGAALLACASASAAQADEANEAAPTELPRWEWGLGVGVVHAPAYLGSSVQRTHVAPLPYFIYRGERLRANREGVGLGLIDTDKLRLDLSLNGALPVKSSGTAREGMRDLPPIVEFGPALKYRLIRENGRYWGLHWPIRHAMGVDRHGMEQAGWISDPTLRIIEPMHIGGVRVDFGLDVGVKFQSATFNNYYYQVRSDEATATRPAYRTGAGYAGTTISTGLLARFDQIVAGAFVGTAQLQGARFIDSPLVERKQNFFGGIALFWVFQKSQEMVPQDLMR